MLSFASRATFDPTRPHVLVIACSDGRLQEAVDEFLGQLGIQRYDRLYAPGGPGALATSGLDYLRSGLFHKECQFLVDAHDLEEVILLFHGPALDGPPSAVCADYRRKRPRGDAAALRELQEADVEAILRDGFGWQRQIRVRVFRAEVRADLRIQFVLLSDSATAR